MRWRPHDLRDVPMQQRPYAATLMAPKAREVYNCARLGSPFPDHDAAPAHKTRPKGSVVSLMFDHDEHKHLKHGLTRILPSLSFLRGYGVRDEQLRVSSISNGPN